MLLVQFRKKTKKNTQTGMLRTAKAGIGLLPQISCPHDD